MEQVQMKAACLFNLFLLNAVDLNFYANYESVKKHNIFGLIHLEWPIPEFTYWHKSLVHSQRFVLIPDTSYKIHI